MAKESREPINLISSLYKKYSGNALFEHHVSYAVSLTNLNHLDFVFMATTACYMPELIQVQKVYIAKANDYLKKVKGTNRTKIKSSNTPIFDPDPAS